MLQLSLVIQYNSLDYAFNLDVPAGQYRIEFYRDNTSGDTNGEGQEFLGFVNVTSTGASGSESYSGTLTAAQVTFAEDDVISATATVFTP